MQAFIRRSLLLLLCMTAGSSLVNAADKADAEQSKTTRGDRLIAEYFRRETRKLADDCLAEIQSAKDWRENRDQYRRRLREMLGLKPWPKRTPLEPAVTGTVEHPQFVVEKLHFQSRPGLYVTGNLYRPKNRDGKLPAILYVCGHGRVKKDGVSYGNKVHYQHHGAWFARNGYVCLTIDTIQLGEIEGIHHGTYSHDMWWWNARGYTPAGVEAWNGIRALDYLQSRPEVDADRMGVTGRSGGGAYSWWIAALDERIKVAVPVAGITNLKNHVIDGCVEGHCDCMYPVNTYRWDFAQVAALVAPRPLLISNTDKDGIFPLDGVVDVYNQTRQIYRLLGAEEKIGLQITEGPHQDTQELRVHAFHWFNEYLKGEDPLIETTAVKFFEPEELKVFETIPEDEKTTTIHETFVPQAEPKVPKSKKQWKKQRREWMKALKTKCFRGWPNEPADLNVQQAFSVERQGIRLSAYDFTAQQPFRLRLYLAQPADLKRSALDLVVLNASDEQAWHDFLGTMQVAFAEELEGHRLPGPDKKGFRDTKQMFESFKWGIAYVAPRGVGPTAWTDDERERTHIRRRFMLLGQTLDGMRVWDVRRAVQALRSLKGMPKVDLWMQGERQMAGVALYASLFEPDVKRLNLRDLPKSHRRRPIFLNVLRFLDVPQAVAMAAEETGIRIYQQDPQAGWQYPQAVAEKLSWKDKQIQIRPLPKNEDNN